VCDTRRDEAALNVEGPNPVGNAEHPAADPVGNAKRPAENTVTGRPMQRRDTA